MTVWCRFVYESQSEMTSWKNALQNGISYALGDDKVCNSDDVDDDDNNHRLGGSPNLLCKPMH